jgi:dienelactone hydrolase
MDSLASRWRRLMPHIEHLTPEGAGPFPTVLIFHGCGGVRDHLRWYARAAVEAGWGALIVDSFAARGWSKSFAKHLVCTGLLLRGRARAADVLATVRFAGSMPAIDPTRLVLAGWSHGAWSIMDMLAQPLTRRGELGLRDAPAASLAGIRAGFFAYPYVGVASASRGGKPWPRALRVFSVVPRRDHLASVRRHMRALASVVSGGGEVEVWSVDATHAFDEPGLKGRVLAYDEDLGIEALERFRGFLRSAAPV